MMRALALCSFVALVLSTASGYSFDFTSTPQQCQNLSISLSGLGTPPYTILVIPFGPSPLPDNTEVRRIFEVQFSGSSTSFQLRYPTNSQFVAVISDSTGFGTGGTSVAATVQSSSDSSCYNASVQVSPDFAFSIVPANQLVECSSTRIWWDPSLTQGTPSFRGVIPGGQSFSVPEGNFSTVPEQGYGFSWTPSVRIGTTVILVGGDNRGAGTGGSGLYIVSQGPSQDCLSADSPSSTPGSPAGGSYPTSTNGAGTSGSASSNHANVGAIAGGVIGGVCGFLAALAFVGLFMWRRRRIAQKGHKDRSIDLLHGPSEEEDNQLPQYYQPEPFVLPDPTVASTTHDGSQELQMREAGAGSEHMAAGRPGTPSGATTTRTRKSAAPPSLRPVNVVQHEDGGPTEGPENEGEPETVELPPAYTNLKSRMPSSLPAGDQPV